MSQKYRTIPTDEDVGGIQPLELESAHFRQHDQTKRQKYVQVMASLFALFVVMVGFCVYKGGGKSESFTEVPIAIPAEAVQDEDMDMDMDTTVAETPTEKKMEPIEVVRDEDATAPETPTNTEKKMERIISEPKLIFCYGDSLTYGYSPPSKEPYPYAIYLEQELNNLYASNTDQEHPATIVEYAGFPGMTASIMLSRIQGEREGICPILHRTPNISLMIILAGTNDILQMTDSGKDVARSFVESLVDLHRGAFECAKGEDDTRFHTVALGIPGAAFAERMHAVSETITYVNGALKEYAASSEGKTTYVDFPFLYEEGDSKWNQDGVHMSEEGYEVLGKELAPHVKNILDSVDQS